MAKRRSKNKSRMTAEKAPSGATPDGGIQRIAVRMDKLRNRYHAEQNRLRTREAQVLRDCDAQLDKLESEHQELDEKFTKEWGAAKEEMDAFVSEPHRTERRESRREAEPKNGWRFSVSPDLARRLDREVWSREMDSKDRVIAVLETDRDKRWKAGDLVDLFGAHGTPANTTRAYLFQLSKDRTSNENSGLIRKAGHGYYKAQPA